MSEDKKKNRSNVPVDNVPVDNVPVDPVLTVPDGFTADEAQAALVAAVEKKAAALEAMKPKAPEVREYWSNPELVTKREAQGYKVALKINNPVTDASGAVLMRKTV